ncbi:MAG: MGMT family protein [Acidobacteriota bacterium]
MVRDSDKKMPVGSAMTENANMAFERVFEKVYWWVEQIPSGKVMTYGQISRLMDERLSARAVGWAMHAIPNNNRKIPWHRVINSRGGISTTKLLNHAPNLQRHLLEEEGVQFNKQGLIDLATYQWQPPAHLVYAKE